MVTTFNSLPLEMQMLICSYLSSTELRYLFAPVCKEWKNLASHMLRRHFTFDGDTQSTKNMCCGKRESLENSISIVRKSFNIQSISFVNILKWYALSRGLPACNYLRRFEFSNCNLDRVTVDRLVARFPAIESVKLVLTPEQRHYFEVPVISRLADWQYLKDVSIHLPDFWFGYHIDGVRLVKFFANTCENLRDFELINVMTDASALTVLTKLHGHTLERLNVNLFPDLTNFTTNSRSINQCLKRCPKLKVLHLTFNFGIANIKWNKMLEELHFLSIPHVNILLRETVYKHLQQLEAIDSPINVELLPTHCPALKWLAIRNHDITDSGIGYLTRYCRKLERLILDGCWRVTSQALRCIIKLKRSRLNRVEFSQCGKVMVSEMDSIFDAARKFKPNLEIIVKNCG